MSDALTTRLKPWQAPAANGCKQCDGPSTYFVIGRVGPIRIRRVSRKTGAIATPEIMTTHACEEHREQIQAEYCDLYGMSDSWPMATGWIYWLKSFWWAR